MVASYLPWTAFYARENGTGVNVLGATATFTWTAPASGGVPSDYTLLGG